MGEYPCSSSAVVYSNATKVNLHVRAETKGDPRDLGEDLTRDADPTTLSCRSGSPPHVGIPTPAVFPWILGNGFQSSLLLHWGRDFDWTQISLDDQLRKRRECRMVFYSLGGRNELFGVFPMRYGAPGSIAAAPSRGNGAGVSSGASLGWNSGGPSRGGRDALRRRATRSHCARTAPPPILIGARTFVSMTHGTGDRRRPHRMVDLSANSCGALKTLPARDKRGGPSSPEKWAAARDKDSPRR